MLRLLFGLTFIPFKILTFIYKYLNHENIYFSSVPSKTLASLKWTSAPGSAFLYASKDGWI